jgi:trk/ktr system potassium uptake protein
MKRDLFVVVVGCGRLGSLLSNRLSRLGHSLVVIDCDEATFSNLTRDFSGFKIKGDATQLSVLRRAKLIEADVCLATTREDNVNLMVAQAAGKLWSVPHVVARVFDPRREEVYRQLGIQMICPTTVAAGRFLQMIEEIASDRAVNERQGP